MERLLSAAQYPICLDWSYSIAHSFSTARDGRIFKTWDWHPGSCIPFSPSFSILLELTPPVPLHCGGIGLTWGRLRDAGVPLDVGKILNRKGHPAASSTFRFFSLHNLKSPDSWVLYNGVVHWSCDFTRETIASPRTHFSAYTLRSLRTAPSADHDDGSRLHILRALSGHLYLYLCQGLPTDSKHLETHSKCYQSVLNIHLGRDGDQSYLCHHHVSVLEWDHSRKVSFSPRASHSILHAN